MLTLLYYLTKLISTTSNKLSNRIYRRIEYKKLCNKIWKHFNDKEVYENNYVTGIFLKKEGCPPTYTSSFQQYFPTSKTETNQTKAPDIKSKPNIKSKEADLSLSAPTEPNIFPFIIPSGSFKISEILMPNDLDINVLNKETPKESKPTSINNNIESSTQKKQEAIVQALSTTNETKNKEQEFRPVRKQMYHRR